MKHKLVFSLKVLVWIILMWAYFGQFMSSSPLALDTDWFSSANIGSNCTWGNEASPSALPMFDCSVLTPIGYMNRGFPILLSGGYTEGPFALAWAINLGYMALVGLGLAFLLFSKFKKAAIVLALLIAIYLLLYLITGRMLAYS